MQPALDLQSNDFVLFQMPERFTLDTGALRARWRALQAKAHPDQFASAGESAKRLAMQWSVRINEAYERLKNPISRAAYLCALRGHPIRAEHNTAIPTAFLMQQIEWREALEEASDLAAIQRLIEELEQAQAHYLDTIARLLDGPSDTQTQGDSDTNHVDSALAAENVRALMFIEKVLLEAQRSADLLSERQP